MPSDLAPGPSNPFYQRDPVLIARGVLHLATRAASRFTYLRDLLLTRLDGPHPLTPSAIIDVIECHDTLRDGVDGLGRALEPVAGWWVADQPPAFAPNCISVAEAILLAAAQMVASLEAAPSWLAVMSESIGREEEKVYESLDTNARQKTRDYGFGPDLTDTFNLPLRSEFTLLCAYAADRAERFEFAPTIAALRCEAASISRRPPPDKNTAVSGRGVWGDHPAPAALTLHDVMEHAKRMTGIGVDESSCTFDQWLASRGIVQNATSPVAVLDNNHELSSFVASSQQKKILAALRSAALRTDDLLEATDLPHSTMMRHMRELRALDKVGHHPKLGYYSTDHPPPELQGSMRSEWTKMGQP